MATASCSALVFSVAGINVALCPELRSVGHGPRWPRMEASFSAMAKGEASKFHATFVRSMCIEVVKSGLTDKWRRMLPLDMI